MIGRLKTVVFDAADMRAEAQFWSAVLGIPVVQEDDDWTTLEGSGARLAVQLAPDHVPPQWPDPARPQQLHLDVQVDDADEAEQQVLTAVGQTVEGDHIGRGGEPVGEAHRHAHARPLGGDRDDG